MNVAKVRAALLALVEALEDDAPGAPKPAPTKPSRKGTAIRVWTPTAPITDLDRERAREIMKRKGIPFR